MKEKISEFIKSKKGGQTLFIAGLVGILLIWASTLFPHKEKTEVETPSPQAEFSAEAYCEELEGRIKTLVAGIAGDPAAIVTVTLETGMTYVYADEVKQNTQADSDRQSEETEQKTVTVKQADGAETPLVLACHMPKVRGVAIVCALRDTGTADAIKSAVMAAFDLTSKKVYIADKGRNITQ